MGYKEERECWILQNFCTALNNFDSQLRTFECGEKGSDDGRLILSGNEIPVQIVTSAGVLLKETSRVNKIFNETKLAEVGLWNVDPVKWIKGALKIKVDKNYTDKAELTILIEFNGLESVNLEYLLRELSDIETINHVKQFKEVYIISPASDGYFITKDTKTPTLLKI
ncbi:MAG: hypothetical protein RLZZ230_809 [Candidatus Parcubacteria bacterium]|jgi:hypothetical protein